jgi:Ca2+-binding RTX toxin-like protein
VRGQARAYTVTAADASAVDQAGTFAYSIDWGDGSGVQMASGPASLTLGHVFPASGSVVVRVTVADKDGGVSPAATQAVAISAAAMQGDTLVVGGTTGADAIQVAPSGTGGAVAVTINGASLGVFQPTGRIVVYAQSGDDTVTLQRTKTRGHSTYVVVPALLFGGAGDDTLDARGSSAGNVLAGGDGADTLLGGGGRDLLLGGAGADVLRAGSGDDILVGGATDFDSDLEALTALIAEWGRTDLSYQARIDHLTGATGGGANGADLLTAATVHDDAATDQLYGEGGQDWFLYTANGAWVDDVRDQRKKEQATPI